MSDRHTPVSVFSQRQVSAVILIAGSVGLCVLLSVLWWHKTTYDPRKVFWGAIVNNLQASGITLTESNTNANATTQEIVQFNFGPRKATHAITTITEGANQVKTEDLSTAAADYTRYLAIRAAGLSKQTVQAAHVIGVWADTTAANASDSKDKGLPNSFGQILTGLTLPLGDLPSTQRDSLMQNMQLNAVYAPSLGKVKKQTVHGRLQYVYKVTMQPILYVRLMQEYAKDMGMHELDGLDANSFATSSPTIMQWTIDVHSRQLVAVDYGSHHESYSAYGLPVTTPAPTHPLTGAELQARIGQLK